MWTISLYELRDGRPGLLTKVGKFGPWQTVLLPILTWADVGHPNRDLSRAPVARHRYREAKIERREIVPPEKMNQALLQLVRSNKGWELTPPVPPSPEIWKQLKKARSVADVQRVARSLRQRRRISRPQSELFHSHAEELLRAKELPHYPKSNRPRSDDKRIQFFAKVLAGLGRGIAPATATKRLAHSVLPDRHSGIRSLTGRATAMGWKHEWVK